ncbi:MAG: biopolymer transporter ExbD [Deltaproteobacteria bacterium]|nr:biopolymer transporter ExbD [Deltaproteobacteria bacterium]
MKKGKRVKAEIMNLNLTSMMDMFTIILVFLIFSFSKQDQNLKLDPDLTLPESTAAIEFKWAINVNLTPTELRVEGNTIAKVKNGKFAGVKVDKDKKRVTPLFNLLKKFKDIESREKVNPTGDETVISLQADKNTSFEIMDLVMKTSAQAGYPNFRFVVLKK